MSLQGDRKKEILKALKSAFPNRQELVMMLSLELDIKESEVPDDSSYNFVVFKLVEQLESQNRIQELIEGACRANPGNPALQQVAKTMKTPSKILPESQANEKNNSAAPTLSGVAAIKRDALTKRLINLQEEYNAVNKQIDTEIDERNRLILERRASHLLEDMEKIENEIRLLN
ncbi:hypothetical protein NUACC21_68360 [Scytonema sp. NUACC21]